MRKLARLRISKELLVDALHMPTDTEIVHVEIDPTSFCSLILTVHHDDLKPVNEGDIMKIDVPKITLVDGKHIWDWNQK